MPDRGGGELFWRGVGQSGFTGEHWGWANSASKVDGGYKKWCLPEPDQLGRRRVKKKWHLTALLSPEEFQQIPVLPAHTLKLASNPLHIYPGTFQTAASAWGLRVSEFVLPSFKTSFL